MPDRKRARKGSVEARLLLRLPSALDGVVRTAAQEDGVSLAEWWRAAAVAALMLRAQEGAAWTGLIAKQQPPKP